MHFHRTLRFAVLAVALPLAGCDWPWQHPPADAPLALSGTVDARQVDLAFQVPGRIVAILADEGGALQAGQAAATLDETDLRLVARRAQAQAEAAGQVLAAMRAGARREELAAAAAAVAQAEADAAFAAHEVVRTQQLVQQQFVSPQQLDRARSAADAARARLEQARQAQALMRAGARAEDLRRAQAELEAAQAQRESAQRQLGYVRLDSPTAGIVSTRLAEPGQVVGAGQPVLRVADLAHPWVRVYLAESELARVRLGQAAQVTVDGLPGRVFHGRLSFISPEAEFTPKTVETRALRVDLVYRAKVEVDDAAGLLKIGMPADVKLALARQP